MSLQKLCFKTNVNGGKEKSRLLFYDIIEGETVLILSIIIASIINVINITLLYALG
jgi:hypothetical protein